MAITIWGSPAGPTFQAWGIGAATGIWSIDWIVFWGVVIYNVLVETGAFAHFRHWLVTQATADVRVQAILMAWALGALLEGLVGFGYPWAVIAPILVGLGVTEIDAIRVAAIGNNALGAPIIALATVHQRPAAQPLRLSGPDRGNPRPSPPVDPHLPGHRPPRPARHLAAAHCGLPVLHPRPVPHFVMARALPARHHRRPGLVRCATTAAAAAILAARRNPRLRRDSARRRCRARRHRAGGCVRDPAAPRGA